jgi:hypothetical protein
MNHGFFPSNRRDASIVRRSDRRACVLWLN